MSNRLSAPVVICCGAKGVTNYTGSPISPQEQNKDPCRAKPILPLPRGYQLLNYTVVKQLSAGGFSIIYLAQDETTNRWRSGIPAEFAGVAPGRRQGGGYLAGKNGHV